MKPKFIDGAPDAPEYVRKSGFRYVRCVWDGISGNLIKWEGRNGSPIEGQETWEEIKPPEKKDDLKE